MNEQDLLQEKINTILAKSILMNTGTYRPDMTDVTEVLDVAIEVMQQMNKTINRLMKELEDAGI